MKSFRLDDIRIYQASLELVKEVYILVNQKPLNRDFSLVDQIKRAAVSIVANIAEGYGRNTKKDFGQFLSIGLGSANEVIALLDVISKVYPVIKTKDLKEKYILLTKQIYTFRHKLTTSRK